MNSKTSLLITGAVLASLALNAQQPAPTMSFRAIIQPGTTIGDHSFTEDTIENVILNDAGEVAFVTNWEVSGEENIHSGLFTSRRIVAIDGETIDGKILNFIAKDPIAINASGHVAYEAAYIVGDKTSHGVFLDHQFQFEIDPNATGTGPDFTLTDDGRIIPRPGLRLIPPSAPLQPKKKSHFSLGSLPVSLPDSVTKRIPIKVKSDDKTDTQQTPNNPPQNAAVQRPVPPAPQPPKPAAPCSMPPFPMPDDWMVGANTEGPATSRALEPAVGDRKFFSMVYGPLLTPFRIVHFNRACKPLLIGIGDMGHPGRFEVWTPAGLITSQLRDGSYEFDGYSGKAKSASFMGTDVVIPINRHGQIVLYIALNPQGHALLLGTPVSR